MTALYIQLRSYFFIIIRTEMAGQVLFFEPIGVVDVIPEPIWFRVAMKE